MGLEIKGDRGKGQTGIGEKEIQDKNDRKRCKKETVIQ